ncbi:hypothetical protein [Capnocytophaga canis]|uniref:hypothetical protein n=1 Tax=Capnocytophaga canis TaxID=1848903 RepID=UPI001561F689|nr:hypothetical protein [Capnocytophaga canis]
MKTNVTKKNEKLTVVDGLYHLRKYNLLKIIDQMPHQQARKIKNEFPQFLNVTRQTFSVWCNLALDDSNDIPAMQFMRICQMLGVQPIEMINDVKRLQPSAEFLYKEQIDILKRTKLTL